MDEDLPPVYHGTRAGFRGRGGLVLPGAQVGRDNTSGSHGYVDHGIPYTGEHVYVTTDRDLAMIFALLAKGRGRPRVLTVQPFGMKPDTGTTYGGEERDDVFTCEWATVLSVEMLDPMAAAALAEDRPVVVRA